MDSRNKQIGAIMIETKDVAMPEDLLVKLGGVGNPRGARKLDAVDREAVRGIISEYLTRWGLSGEFDFSLHVEPRGAKFSRESK